MDTFRVLNASSFIFVEVLGKTGYASVAEGYGEQYA